MIIFPFKLWWLPTREDTANYRKQQVDNARKELPTIINKMVEATNEQSEAIVKLEKTFTMEQMSLWLKIKEKGQEAVFQNGRREYMTNLYFIELRNRKS
jgi:hypothetical protein